MADNERVEWSIIDTYYGANTPAQSERTDYYPGVAGSKRGDEAWRDFKVPVGNRNLEKNGPVEMERSRIVKLGRGSVCDQVRAAPQEEGTKTTSLSSDRVWGTDSSPSHDLTQTETQDVDGSNEDSTGHDAPRNIE